MMKLKLQNGLKRLDRQVLLVILDGVGYTPKGAEFGNAVSGARLPVLNSLWDHSPTIHIRAHGTAVGMPSDDDMGNSEVGHNVLGCGRVFDQGAKLVSQSIQTGEMFKGHAWQEIATNVREKNSTLHFLGLFSDGNVHSHIDHLRAMIEEAKKTGIKKVRIHVLLDGRDVPEKSALEYVEPFEAYLEKLRSNELPRGGGGCQSLWTGMTLIGQWSNVVGKFMR
jgi:2,3-bisphosphoglycerate-independent phosphoglycerate mutase